MKEKGTKPIQIGVIFATKLVQIEVDQSGLTFEDFSDFVRISYFNSQIVKANIRTE